MPREYDREYTKNRSQRAQVRAGYSSNAGEITRFVLQLEYRRENTWRQVVRFDHDTAAKSAHDVTREGVHVDVYRDGEKLRSEEIFPPMRAADALTFAADHLAEHAERYIERYEEWHGIKGDR